MYVFVSICRGFDSLCEDLTVTSSLTICLTYPVLESASFTAAGAPVASDEGNVSPELMISFVCRDLVCDLYVDNFARAERLHRAAGLRKRVEPLYFDSPQSVSPYVVKTHALDQR